MTTLDARFEALAGKVLDAEITRESQAWPGSDLAVATATRAAAGDSFVDRLQRLFKADALEQGSVLHAAQQRLAANQPYQAAALLIAAQAADAGSSAAQEIALASALLACGLPERAQVVFDALALDTPNPDADRLRLDLAEWQLRHAALERAATLLAVPPANDHALRLRWAGLEARLLLAQQRPAQAVARLTAALGGDALALLAMSQNGDLSIHYLRYNLAVALVRNNQPDDAARARSLLDQVGQLKADSTEARALRDRANLSLGDWLLRDGQGATAREMYQRIQSQGPFANRALLGLGWASVAGSGTAQRSKALNPPTTAYRDTPAFVLRALRQRDLIGCREHNRQPHAVVTHCESETLPTSTAGSTDEQRRKRALVPWLMLVERDADDPAAREAELAIAATLKALGAHQESASRYEQAVATLQAHVESLQAQAQRWQANGLPPPPVDSGAFAAAITLEPLIDTLPASRVQALSTDTDFMAAWTGAVRAQRLAAPAADDSLRAALQALSEDYRQHATAVAIAQGERELALLRRYQEAALKALLNPYSSGG